ncbi:unnamed protein product, partial [Rotaria sp. Silwood2]
PLECLHQGTCDITFNTRHHCSACRLTKCFNSGMRRERLLIILKENQTKIYLLIKLYIS